MKQHLFKFIAAIVLIGGLAGFAAPASAAAQTGQPAPDFTATDVHGQEFRLSDHKGKIVVLEWTNHQCPYVVKHYDSGNMQETQRDAKAQGAEWVTIVSSAPGKQGHTSREEAISIMTEAGAEPTTKILDESGEIGKMYGAATTPHMFVINAEGVLVYAGAIDDNSSAQLESVEGAKNYVLAALEALKAGRAVATPVTEAYGCGVKYAD